MSPSYRACLADFGLAIAIDTNPALTSSMSSKDGTAGTLRWQAPELLPNMENREHKQRKTKATDVYAFALVCYEVSDIHNNPYARH
jgi:serine/threonine protein kinase